MGKRVDIPSNEYWHPGEDKSHVIPVTNESAAAVSMTGWSLKYSIRRTRGGATLSPFTNKTDSSGITLSTRAATNDTATITILAADTTGMTGVVWYVLERTDSGSAGVIAEGTIPFGDG